MVSARTVVGRSLDLLATHAVDQQAAGPTLLDPLGGLQLDHLVEVLKSGHFLASFPREQYREVSCTVRESFTLTKLFLFFFGLLRVSPLLRRTHRHATVEVVQGGCLVCTNKRGCR